MNTSYPSDRSTYDLHVAFPEEKKETVPVKVKDSQSNHEVRNALGIALITTTIIAGTVVPLAEHSNDNRDRALELVENAVSRDGFSIVNPSGNKGALIIEGDVGAPEDKGSLNAALQIGRCVVPGVVIDLYTAPNGTVDATEYVLPANPSEAGNRGEVTVSVTKGIDVMGLSQYHDCFGAAETGIGG